MIWIQTYSATGSQKRGSLGVTGQARTLNTVLGNSADYAQAFGANTELSLPGHFLGATLRKKLGKNLFGENLPVYAETPMPGGIGTQEGNRLVVQLCARGIGQQFILGARE